VKFSYREIGKDFFIKIRNFKLWKMSKLLDSRFPEGLYFSIVTILNLKDLLKQMFLFAHGIAGRLWVSYKKVRAFIFASGSLPAISE